MDTILDIGRILVSARRQRHLSQAGLGALAGTSQQQIARWERAGYQTTRLDHVAHVASILGVSIGGTTSDVEVGLIAAEPPASYAEAATRPVRDLGEVAARLRAAGSVLAEEYGIRRIGVFGSFARGLQTEHSDVDLLIEFEDASKSAGFRFVAAASWLEGVLGRKVDFTQSARLKEQLRSRVLEEVIYVWETRFFSASR